MHRKSVLQRGTGSSVTCRMNRELISIALIYCLILAVSRIGLYQASKKLEKVGKLNIAAHNIVSLAIT